ncbi:ROK family protein [Flavimarina sp. Hel_I_48]|uniref:ROK family protein n=1 Tax=Flavimarina sp. Hel_I_48 TaxID=1392488 RepID=UPI0004DECE20|nr:ROK family protein [Flavimarina sp. Hel_I_48]
MATVKMGIDIGATKTHIGIIKDAQVIDEVNYPTQAQASQEAIIEELIAHMSTFANHGFESVGIGVPGLVDENSGIVYDLTNIPSWQHVPLKERLEGHFKIPVRITNDANMFALGEKAYGSGKKYQNLVGITLGSGFGAGLVINGNLYSGILSSAGEMADIPYLNATIEDYCSGKFFREHYGVEGVEVSKKAAQGDPESIRIFHEFGTHVGAAVRMLMNILSPEAIFFGGSVSKSFSLFEQGIWDKLNAYPFERVKGKLHIAASQTPNISILGAAALIDGNE